jgi:integrase
MSERTYERARDSRGRPVPGLYLRDGRYVAGASVAGRWQLHTLQASSFTAAKRERTSWLAGLAEGRIAQRDGALFEDVFAEHQGARSLSERTRAHERHLLERHLAGIRRRRVQDLSATELAHVLRGMRERYSPWTQVAVFRILAGTFALAMRRGIITRNPLDGLAPSERPRQRNAKRIARLDADALGRLVAAGASERWRVALALAGYAGLRLGEIRALTWADVDRKAGALSVSSSLLPDGTRKAPKTEAGVRTVPMLPALRRLLLEWQAASPHARPDDYVIGTAEGGPVGERNLRRALEAAKTAAGLDSLEARLSWHSLRHSCLSVLATELELPATTLARIGGHADAGFTLKVYAKDARDESALIADVLGRASSAGVGA